ncbi:MAG: 2,3-bisphosphoglycerate-independent phosphoglycerate mutase [Anaerolineaceae bacterium]
MEFDTIKPLLKEDAKSKIVLLVMDGLGGLPIVEGGKTELESAIKPNMDALAARSVLGLHHPLPFGLTPGSGPAHLGLFGYDPTKFEIGRGVLSALGVDFDLQDGDVPARGNFCTVDQDGFITDRRAGRIPTEVGEKLCSLLMEKVHIPGVQVLLQAEKEYRFVFVLRGEGLSGDVSDTDPQAVGKKPHVAQALTPEAEKTAGYIREFVRQGNEVLAREHPANSFVLRGFAQMPKWPKFGQAWGLDALAIAMYPMYRGVAKVVGMTVMPAAASMDEEITMLEQNWDKHDFFFVHIKKTDSYGEDGNFDAKVHVIEEVDALLPRVLALNPDVLIVTGDHSTPAKLRSHSWHPVPVMLYSPDCRPDGITSFGERACAAGSLGSRFEATDLMPYALAHAGRLEKFGA